MKPAGCGWLQATAAGNLQGPVELRGGRPEARYDLRCAPRCEWKLKRNCSASPGQFAGVLALLGLVSVGIATVFAWSGAWWVLVFSGGEVAALVVAFVVYARHAGDYERVVVTPEALIIELNNGNRFSREETHPAWTRVEYPCARLEQHRDEGLIGLATADRAVGIGRYIPPPERARLAREIRTELSAACRGGDR